MTFLKIRIAKDPEEWNEIVDKSTYSVLYHRYELYQFYTSTKNALPIIIEENGRRLLFPLSTTTLLKSFRIATSPIHYHASILPATEEALSLIPDALDHVSNFLREMKVDYLSASAPSFLPRRYVTLVDSWFRKHKASVQTIYAQMVHTQNATFEEIFRHRFQKRNRQGIRRALRDGVSVIEIDTEAALHNWMDDIHKCNVASLLRQGRWGAYPDSFKDVFLSELISAKKVLGKHFRIYGVTYRDRLIAYQTVLEYNKLMAGTKTASNAKYLDKHPNEVLVAHLIKEACERDFHWLEKGFDRVKSNEKIPSLYPGLKMWKHKFGFEEIPVFIYRLGLTRPGRILQGLYATRENLVTRSAYLPKSIRTLFVRLYAPRRRKLTGITHV